MRSVHCRTEIRYTIPKTEKYDVRERRTEEKGVSGEYLFDI